MGKFSDSDDFLFDEEFDWTEYLRLRNAEEVPEIFFYHVCKSELNGIELGSVVEVENEDKNGYWFASICSSKGVLINLHYFGDENDKHDFWLEVKSPRIHSLNWGSENKKKLIPPFPDRFSRVNPRAIKEKVQDCENVVSDSVLQMKGAPIYNIFKRGMFVEIQDKEYPYRVWVSKIYKNVGGRLFLKMQGISCPEKEGFWLFYLNERIFPLGWADQKGLPWRVMHSDFKVENPENSSLLLNVLKPKTPEQHSYKIGEMLEVINPYSLMVFYVATIAKIYDNRYFKVEVNNDSDVEKCITFVATKDSPYLFNAGWANKHKFLLKPPSDWKTSNTFCWSEYLSMKGCKLATVDNNCKKVIDRVRIGSKLEAVDPVFPNCIRVATVKGFADNWMFLSFDRTSWCQELLHVRSVCSDDVFPVGWCNKHRYSLSAPKLPYTDCNDYENYYYSSDIEIDLNGSDKNNLKYSHYFKGEIPYHFSKKNSQSFEENLEESLQSILNDCVENNDVSKTANNKILITQPNNKILITQPNNKILITQPNIKIEQPDLDEDFHDALFLEEEVDAKKIEKENVINKSEKNNDDNIKEVHAQKRTREQENISNIPIKRFYTNIYKMCIYFNKDCYPGSNLVKNKIANIPCSIGPGPVSRILHEAITIFVNLDYFPNNALKKLKKVQKLLFNEPGGVELFVTTKAIKPHSSHSERLILPESKMMAQTYCSALCNLFGMCEYFMTTENTQCTRGCNLRTNDNKTMARNDKSAKKKEVNYTHSEDVGLLRQISKNREKIKYADENLIWKNESALKCYRHYLGLIANYKAHIIKLDQCRTPVESAMINEILMKKNELCWLDTLDVCSSTKPESYNKNQFCFVNNWKTSFENYFSQLPMFRNSKIDIGHFESIEIKSDPWCWCPKQLHMYLKNDPFCRKIAKKFSTMAVDGQAFMLLNDEYLHWLEIDINLEIRLMCHIAECNYVHYTKYNNHRNPTE